METYIPFNSINSDLVILITKEVTKRRYIWGNQYIGITDYFSMLLFDIVYWDETFKVFGPFYFKHWNYGKNLSGIFRVWSGQTDTDRQIEISKEFVSHLDLFNHSTFSKKNCTNRSWSIVFENRLNVQFVGLYSQESQMQVV